MGTQTVSWPQLNMIDTNEERADMVRPILLAYKREFYGDTWEDEPDSMVLSDMVANLLHLADLIPDGDGTTVYTGENAQDRAWFHYTEEIKEAEWEREQEAKCESSTGSVAQV